LKKAIYFLTILMLTASLGGCIKNTKLSGYTLDKKKLDSMQEGKTRKAVVRRELGSPSSTSFYGDETWYYISSEYESVAFLDPKVKSRTVIAITFNDDQSIKTIKTYNESDSKKIAIESDTTKTEGHDIGIIGQLLGNVGRFNSNKYDPALPRN